ncbi:formimidoyltransferase-cyclodeaminase [Crotalus adamanteus]|uniref:Formimidoyltransferase-cyclodeaminase n=1 Tax=Crotalus adamanteus TaxID=8729 RepID=A0AAW1C959_CROAD
MSRRPPGEMRPRLKSPVQWPRNTLLAPAFCGTRHQYFVSSRSPPRLAQPACQAPMGSTFTGGKQVVPSQRALDGGHTLLIAKTTVWCRAARPCQQLRREAAAQLVVRSPAQQTYQRTAAMQLGLKNAVDVPFSLAEKVNSLWPFLKEMAQHGNIACKSDIQVAAKALEAGVFGAYFNVIINLKDITDEDFTQQMHKNISYFLEEAQKNTTVILDHLDKRAI